MYPELEISKLDRAQESTLPLSAMVRAVCRTAQMGPELLYEAMLKMSLAVEEFAPTYGLSIWTLRVDEPPRVRWAEGLNDDELDEGVNLLTAALASKDASREIKAGDLTICLALSIPLPGREGAAIFARCVRPLNATQAQQLRSLVDVAQLAHAYASVNLNRLTIADAGPRTAAASASLPGMVFTSQAMADVARSVERIKDSESAVLITGESGTGKELIARAVHRLSKRATQPFVPFNCSAVPPELVESILFGHRKGSFTGALSENQGLIRAAENGTLFLDEIGDLPLPLQPKLLRFLQEGEVHTLGDSAPRRVNVRVIAATHKGLEELTRLKTFREDLYYRIATLQIHLPPLRKRPEDTAVLISHFLSHFARRNDHPIAGITGDAIHALQAYAWPGNVRELGGEIERLVLYAEKNSYISIEQIHPRILPLDSSLRSNPEGVERTLDELLEDYERRLITQTLKEHDCNIARTSAALGLGSRQTLYKKLKRLTIDIGEFLQEDTEPGLQLRSPLL